MTTHRSLAVDAGAPAASRGRNAAFLALTLAIFVALTAVMTFPQVLRMSDGVHDPGDPLMVTWVLAWVAHQLPNAPAHIFDANIFYPERNTLAYSETLLVPGMLAAPLHWLGVAPILVYNLVFLSGFALSGVGVALLVRRLTGNTGAAIVAGIVFAFPPYRIDHYAHLQLQQTQFIPLAMWAFHRLLDSGRLRDGVLLGVCTACQMLSCMYYGLFLIPYMAVVCGAMLIAARTLSKQRIIALAVAAAIVIVAMIPVGRAYLAAREVVGERGRAEVAAEQRDLAQLSRAAGDERNVRESVRAVHGARTPAVPRVRRGGSRHRRPLAIRPRLPADAAVCVRAGPDPRVRRVARFQRRHLSGAVRLLPAVQGAAHPCAHGADGRLLARRARGLRCDTDREAAALAGLATRRADDDRDPDARRVCLDASRLWAAPRHPPEAYADLLRDADYGPTSVIFEFPTGAMEDPEYLYYSTFHWQYLVNGYSGFFPPSYQKIVNAVRDFPDEASMDMVRSRGVRYLVIHGEWLYGARYEQLVSELDRRSDLRLVSRHPWQREDKHAEISVYRVLINTDATSR